MSLVVNISINGVTPIGSILITRKTNTDYDTLMPDDVSDYAVKLILPNGDVDGMGWITDHRYGDGAYALAKRALDELGF